MFESADGEPLPIRNRVAAEVDFRGIETVLSYDQRGNLTGHSRGGVTVEYAVLPNGDRHITTDGNGDTLTHDYDAYGQEIAQTDVIGQRWRKHFDARGRLLWSEDGLSRRTEFDYDLLDRPTRVRHPAIDDALSDGGRAEDITEYLDAERRIRITDGRGVISTRLHDAMGRVVEEVEAVGLPEQRRRSMRHDANGNTVESRSWRGNLTTSLYDAANRLVQRDEPLGRRTSYTYDPLGNVLSETIADSTAGASAIPRQTEHGYADPFYRRTSTRRIGEDLVLETTASWDANGNLVAETDANGKLTRHSYDQRDRLHVSTYSHGRVITRSYDGADRKLSETLSDANADEDRFVPQQRTWRYDQRGRQTAAIDAERGTTLTGYDGADNPVLVTDPTGGQWSKVYDARNRLTEERGPIGGQVTDYGLDHQGNRIATFSPDGRELIQTYDGLGRLQQTSDQLGRIETLRHDADGNLLERRDAMERPTTSVWDALGREESRTLPEVEAGPRVQRWTYTPVGEVQSETDAGGHTTTHGYDAFGRRLHTRGPPVDENPDGHLRSVSYDAHGNVLTETDARGATTTYRYDDLHRRIEQIDPPLSTGDRTRHTQTWTYDVAGNVRRHTDRNGLHTDITYDRENRVRTRSRADGSARILVETLSYDAAGRLRERSDALGRLTTITYDRAGRKVTEQRPLQHQQTWTWHPFNQIASHTDADDLTTTYTYDVRQRLEEETDPSEATTTYRYDLLDRRIERERPEGGRWRYAYEGESWLTEVISPEEHRTVYGYDRDGNRVSIEDANRHRTRATFDAAHRQTATQFADAVQATYGYDGNANRVRSEQAGRRIDTTHDALNREIHRRYAAGPEDLADAAQPTAYTSTYDGNGQLLTLTVDRGDGAATLQRQWDLLGRLIEETDLHGQTRSWTYDDAGNRRERNDPFGRTLYTPDDLDRVADISQSGSLPLSLRYTLQGRLARLQHGSIAEASYRYQDGRLDSLEHRQTGQIVADYAFRYDRNGNRIEERLSSGGATRTTTYELDDDDRLTRVEGPEETRVYALDAVGNRVSETVTTSGSTARQEIRYTYNERDQLEERHDLVANATTRYAYDAHGNLAREAVGTRTVLYRHNAQDRLATLTLQGAPPAQATHYRYAPDGLRIEKRDGLSASRFHYDQGQLRGETNVLGDPTRQYQYANGHVLAERRADGTQLHFLHDALRSPVRLIQPDGATAGTRRYGAWGEVEARTGVESYVGFTGYYVDAESGLNYAQQRYHLPGVGRFLSVDPWEGDTSNPITLNKYLYANGNPLIYLDPDGRCAWQQSERECFDSMAESIGADISTRKGFQRTADMHVETAKAQAQGVALVGGGGLIAQGLRRVVGEVAKYGLRGAVRANPEAVVVLGTEATVTTAAIVSGADVPQSAAFAAGRRALTQSSQALDAQLDALQPVLRQADEVPPGLLARVADQQGKPASVIEAADSKPAMIPGSVQVGSTYQEWLNQTPVKGGWWNGSRGESTFYSRDPVVQRVTRDRGITYSDARPDFSPYSAAEVEIANMTANRPANFMQADQEIAQRMGVPRREVTRWRKENGYTWHEDDTTRMQLVPTEINAKHGHLGGVGEIKRQER